MLETEEEIAAEDMDPSVPTDLLDLYVELEESGVESEKMGEAFA